MYVALMLACVAFFCLSVPVLLYRCATRPEMRWWRVVTIAVASGWICVNLHATLERLEVDQSRREETECFAHPSPPTIVQQGSGETIVENPCGIGEYLEESYEPLFGLIYGPLYLLWCGIPYWLLVGLRWSFWRGVRVASIALAVLGVEWMAVIGYDGLRFFTFDLFERISLPFSLLPLTIGIALTVSSIVVTLIIQRIDGRSTSA